MNQKIIQNAHKFTYLAKVYPDKNVPQLTAMLQLPNIDINAAVWGAIELGLLDKVEASNPFPVVHEPKEWKFGRNVADLEAALTYTFGKLNAEEKDMEENYLNNWVAGYIPHDYLIAIKHLQETHVLHEYQIEDGESSYIFYTLYENRDKAWGQKQFKTNPLTGEKNETEEEEKTDEAATTDEQ